MKRLIGLTGQTGAGKTTVASILKDRGFYVIDGDLVAREIVSKGSPVLSRLAEAFGEDIILPDGELNRAALAKRAFKDRESTDLLNSITHPAIIEIALARADEAFSKGYDNAVFDAAALFESGFHRLCHKTIAVIAPKEVRLERILNRDGITEQQALTRINAQQNEQYYISNADIIIRCFPPYDLDRETDNAITAVTEG